MLIVLTSERALENEADQINELFANGLEVLHFRKPTFDKQGYSILLNQIAAKYHSRIMLHQYHELCEEFGLRGIHLQEQPRRDLKDQLTQYVDSYLDKGYKVSSSFHSKEDIKNCTVSFEYVLLSPVFGSISKTGYKGKGFDVNDLKEFVIGMGGINESTLQATFDLGFKGVGVLGGVWNAENALKSFNQIYNAYKKTEKQLTN